MLRKKTMLATCISAFLIALTFSSTASAQTYTVGVKTGDWTAYSYLSLEYASNMPGYEKSPFGNMTTTYADILNVDNGNVTVKYTTIYANGTEQTDTTWGNVTSGEGNLSIGIIPANLSQGAEIPANLTWYTEEPLRLTINGTATRRYAGANREVNYANVTHPLVYGNTTYGYLNLSYYWDKKTGLICYEWMSYKTSYTVNATHYYYNMSMTWRMAATTIWPAVFTVQDGYTFNVTMLSNSTISAFNFNETLKQISFNATGTSGKTGYCNITIPKDLLQGSPWTILLNGTDYTSSCTITSNSTHAFIYIPYTHSTNTIQVIGTWAVPEFPSVAILPLLIIATIVSAIAYGKRRKT